MTKSRTADLHARCKKRPCNVCRAWQPDEDALLGELAGTMPLPDLIDRINQEYGHLRPDRSKAAITCRVADLGLTYEYTEGLTMQQLVAIVNWGDHSIVRHWIEPGLLVASKIRGRGRAGRWQIMEADLERFITQHVWAYDWTLFAPGRFRSLAEVASRRSPWRTERDLRRYLGIRWPNFWEKHWRQIEHKRRHHGSRHALGSALIHQDTFPEIRASLDFSRFTAIGATKKREPRTSWRRTCRTATCRAVTTGLRSEPIPLHCPLCGYALKRKDHAA